MDTYPNAQYMINKTSLNKDKLLVVCDSFGVANSQLYNETFNTIWKFHYIYVNGSELSTFISKHKPDIVIYQVVERALYNEEIVKKLSSNIANINQGNKIFSSNDIKYNNHNTSILNFLLLDK